MKVYVDEMPKCCYDCPCFNDGELFRECNLDCDLDIEEYVTIDDKYCEHQYSISRHKDCTLQQLPKDWQHSDNKTEKDWQKVNDNSKKLTKSYQNMWEKLKEWLKTTNKVFDDYIAEDDVNLINWAIKYKDIIYKMQELEKEQEIGGVMERLTKKLEDIYISVFPPEDVVVKQDAVLGCVYVVKNNKLGQLEDLMEKYSVEDLNALEMILDGNAKIKNNVMNSIDKLKKENQKLKNQLKNAIVPKFKVGQEVWFVDCGKVKYDHIITIKITDKGIVYFTKYHNYNENLFASKEEAEKKLEEIRNEGN